MSINSGSLANRERFVVNLRTSKRRELVTKKRVAILATKSRRGIYPIEGVSPTTEQQERHPMPSEQVAHENDHAPNTDRVEVPGPHPISDQPVVETSVNQDEPSQRNEGPDSSQMEDEQEGRMEEVPNTSAHSGWNGPGNPMQPQSHANPEEEYKQNPGIPRTTTVIRGAEDVPMQHYEEQKRNLNQPRNISDQMQRTMEEIKKG
jgi:hypothetical protein